MSFEFTKQPYTLKAVSSANDRPYDEDRFRLLACKDAIFIIELDGHGGDTCVNIIISTIIAD